MFLNVMYYIWVYLAMGRQDDLCEKGQLDVRFRGVMLAATSSAVKHVKLTSLASFVQCQPP